MPSDKMSRLNTETFQVSPTTDNKGPPRAANTSGMRINRITPVELSLSISAQAMDILRDNIHLVVPRILSANPSMYAMDLLRDNIHLVVPRILSANTSMYAVKFMYENPTLIDWIILSANRSPYAMEILLGRCGKINWDMLKTNPSKHIILEFTSEGKHGAQFMQPQVIIDIIRSYSPDKFDEIVRHAAEPAPLPCEDFDDVGDYEEKQTYVRNFDQCKEYGTGKGDCDWEDDHRVYAKSFIAQPKESSVYDNDDIDNVAKELSAECRHSSIHVIERKGYADYAIEVNGVSITRQYVDMDYPSHLMEMLRIHPSHRITFDTRHHRRRVMAHLPMWVRSAAAKHPFMTALRSDTGGFHFIGILKGSDSDVGMFIVFEERGILKVYRWVLGSVGCTVNLTSFTMSRRDSLNTVWYGDGCYICVR